jgi:hypothetical protein
VCGYLQHYLIRGENNVGERGVMFIGVNIYALYKLIIHSFYKNKDHSRYLDYPIKRLALEGASIPL